ncbi:hypothetical protein C8R44DRAFT_159189 [Mycena epipterygia]|nr:hypothetical protein C8R44DRAFT_159189 [Mycena epipterygia]
MTFITRAGLPTTTLLGATSLVTTLPAPTVTPLPIVTPARIMAAPPIQQSSPIRTERAHSRPLVPFLSSGRNGCSAVYIWTLGPNMIITGTHVENDVSCVEHRVVAYVDIESLAAYKKGSTMMTFQSPDSPSSVTVKKSCNRAFRLVASSSAFMARSLGFPWIIRLNSVLSSMSTFIVAKFQKARCPLCSVIRTCYVLVQ